uniref:Uncharacterized protein n=2 Tax=Picea TaxID=3328 RepID=A0A101M0B2_PICGL|nr:hypothetical protein ABT39_MTgene4691 [Picea glauca]QHR92679.1 hypothetical protein Q903MT_gene6727 [Picea sitchensis]
MRLNQLLSILYQLSVIVDLYLLHRTLDHRLLIKNEQFESDLEYELYLARESLLAIVLPPAR